MLFVYYPKCSTCMKAKKWLDDHGIAYTERHIKEDPPSATELQAWHQQSKQPLKKIFNTSGMLYRELQLKDKIPALSTEEQYRLLASDGMLVKRPLLITETEVIIGFKAQDWTALLLKAE